MALLIGTWLTLVGLLLLDIVGLLGRCHRAVIRLAGRHARRRAARRARHRAEDDLTVPLAVLECATAGYRCAVDEMTTFSPAHSPVSQSPAGGDGVPPGPAARRAISGSEGGRRAA